MMMSIKREWTKDGVNGGGGKCEEATAHWVVDRRGVVY
jgi:hypothetical protein